MNKLIPFALFFVVLSCKNKDVTKISEGIIEYDITYFSDSAYKIPEQFLPKTMIFQFNQNYASYKIDLMGMFCITNITNLSKRTHTSVIKLFNNKYKYAGSKNENPVFFKPGTSFLIKETDDTLAMAGLPCRKTIITDLKCRRKFDVVYTDKFRIETPNINTPYSEIDGILMKFEIDLGTMRMTLKAKKVTPGPVKNSEFKVADDYMNISQTKMREIIGKMLQ